MASLVLIRGLTGTGKSALLNHLIGRDDLNIKKLEVDDIKRKKYGTTTRCNPKVDSQDAGKQAREILRNGFSVAIMDERSLSLKHTWISCMNFINLVSSSFSFSIPYL